MKKRIIGLLALSTVLGLTGCSQIPEGEALSADSKDADETYVVINNFNFNVREEAVETTVSAEATVVTPTVTTATTVKETEAQKVAEGTKLRVEQPKVPTVAQTSMTANMTASPRTTVRTTTEVNATKTATPKQNPNTTKPEMGEQTLIDVLLGAILEESTQPPTPWYLTEEETTEPSLPHTEEEPANPSLPQAEEELASPSLSQTDGVLANSSLLQAEEELPNPTLPMDEEEELEPPPAPWLNDVTVEGELPNPTLSMDEEEELEPPPAPWLNDVTVEEELPNPELPQENEEELPNPTLSQEEEEELEPPPAPQDEPITTENSTEVANDCTVENTVEEVPYVVEPPDRNPEPRENRISELPDVVIEEVWNQKEKYPNMHIGVGIYSLDGAIGYTYNSNDVMPSGCTVKAAYAMYVLQECEKQGIDIEDYYLTYKEKHKNNGSGVIRDSFEFGQELSLKYLVKVLLRESDNTAYNILLDKFTLSGYQKFLNQIGGQQLGGVKYGRASVEQRKNEWLEIYSYINSNAKYAENLRSFLSGSKYCYIVKGMTYNHSYLHKSGWIEGSTYTCAGDCAIVDNAYLVVVLTYDPVDDVSNAGAVKAIGRAVEKAVASNIELFS